MAPRLEKSRLLDHPLRQTIYGILDRTPGASFTALVDALKSVPGHSSLGHGSLSYHLYQMERAGLITTRRSGRCRRHYAGQRAAFASALAVIQSTPGALVNALIQSQGQVNQQILCGMVGNIPAASQQNISHHLRRLEQEGLVDAERQGRCVLYRPTDRLRSILEKKE